jgi:ribonuclease P protein component
VTRNQIKRYVRQVFHEFDGQLHNDVDYVIIARKPTATMDYFEVQQSLSHVLRLAHVLKKFKHEQGKQPPAKSQGEKTP